MLYYNMTYKIYKTQKISPDNNTKSH